MYLGKTLLRLLALAVLGIFGLTYSTANYGPEAFYGQYCFQSRYGVLQAGFIPFAIGGLAYFYQPVMYSVLIKYRALAATSFCTLFVLSCVSAGPYTG